MKELARRFIVAVTATFVIATAPMGLSATAVDLNAIDSGTPSVTESVDNSTGDSGLSATYETLYGNTAITQEEAAQAAKLAAPVVKLIRIVMSLILAVLPVLMFLNSVVDIACLTISPLRRAILASDGGSGGASMGGGFGMGQPAGGGGEPQGFKQTLAQWASHEAVETAKACSGGGAGGAPMGGGFGMGQPAGGGSPKAKDLLFTYFKKRVVFLVLFGVCIIVFSCTAFTDLGLEVGAWIVTKVGGVSL